MECRLHKMPTGASVLCGSLVAHVFAGEFDNRWPAEKAYDNPAITRAMEAVREGIERCKDDPTRPVYHFRPPARWMNDPCGAIYHNGYYHVFYQLNPTGDFWGTDNTHWGHTRSKDLVHWEHLPIAIWPSRDHGERRCNSGCVAMSGNGRPMIFYTYVPMKRGVSRQQWAAGGDDDLITWTKHPGNPVVDRRKSGIPSTVGHGWSDPFVFRADGKTFVTFKSSGGAVCVARNEELTEWRYVGSLAGVHGECPNFVKLSGKWVLLTSGSDRSQQLQYQVGAFDPHKLEFKAEKRGVLDHSYGPKRPDSMCRGFYATNTLLDPAGRCVLFGWISGFTNSEGRFYGMPGQAKGRGWNGCLGLPRILTLGPEGRPRQAVVPELRKLRHGHVRVDALHLNDRSHVLDKAAGDTLEILAVFEPRGAKAYGIRVRRSEDGERAIRLHYDGRILNVAGTKVPIDLDTDHGTLALHIFLDKSVMEVFVSGGRDVVTQVIYPGLDDRRIELFARGGNAVVRSIDVWQIKPIWPN